MVSGSPGPRAPAPPQWVSSQVLLCRRCSHHQTTKVKQLAADLGITRVRVVANKVRNADDEAFLKARIPEDALLGFIHYDADVIDADRRGMSPYDTSARTVDEIRAIKARIDSEKEA